MTAKETPPPPANAFEARRLVEQSGCLPDAVKRALEAVGKAARKGQLSTTYYPKDREAPHVERIAAELRALGFTVDRPPFFGSPRLIVGWEGPQPEPEPEQATEPPLEARKEAP